MQSQKCFAPEVEHQQMDDSDYGSSYSTLIHSVCFGEFIFERSYGYSSVLYIYLKNRIKYIKIEHYEVADAILIIKGKKA